MRNSVRIPDASENGISHIYRGSPAGMMPVAGQYIDDGRREAHGEAVCDLYIRESQPGRGAGTGVTADPDRQAGGTGAGAVRGGIRVNRIF